MTNNRKSMCELLWEAYVASREGYERSEPKECWRYVGKAFGGKAGVYIVIVGGDRIFSSIRKRIDKSKGRR